MIKVPLKILSDRLHNNPSVLFTRDVWHQEGMSLDEGEDVQTGKRSVGSAGAAVHFHQQHQSFSEII